MFLQGHFPWFESCGAWLYGAERLLHTDLSTTEMPFLVVMDPLSPLSPHSHGIAREVEKYGHAAILEHKLSSHSSRSSLSTGIFSSPMGATAP